MLYYTMRLGGEQIPAGKVGDKYPLPPICAVAIVDNDPWKKLLNTTHFEYPDYLSVFRLENINRGNPYPASLELILVELPKFKKSVTELTTRLDKWLFLLKNLSSLIEQPPVFDGPIFDNLFQLADLTNLSGKDKHMLIDHERDMRNKLSRYREEGLQQGIMKGKIITVREMIKNTDFTDQQIAALAKVDEELVGQIRKLVNARNARPIKICR